MSDPSLTVEGVFAVKKPNGPSSAQVLRDLQSHFNPSELFKPWLAAARSARLAEARTKHRHRRDKRPLQVKLGHGGTLDPMATGVLVVGVGSGTKEMQSFLQCTKTYDAIALFGAASDSYDVKGKIIGTAPYAHITRDKVEQALAQFRGQIMQKPPVFSAIRVNGKRLYEYAREGANVPEVAARPVEVKELELLEWYEGGTHEFQWPQEHAPEEEKVLAEKLLHIGENESANSTRDKKRKLEEEEEDATDDKASKRARQDDPRAEARIELGATEQSSQAATPSSNPTATPKPPLSGALNPRATPQHPAEQPSAPGPPQPPAARIRVTASSGFFVRSLCHDLGAAVGSLAMMAALVRSRQGDFELGKNVFDFDDLDKGEAVWAPKIRALLADWQQRQQRQRGHAASDRATGKTGGGRRRSQSRERLQAADGDRNSSSEG